MGAATSKRRGGSAAAVLDSPWRRSWGDDTALGALPTVLDRMVAAFGLRAALAFQPEQPAVLAVHPPGAADQALLARIGVLAMAQRDSAPGPRAVTRDGQRAGGSFGAGGGAVPVRAGPDRRRRRQ